ncbi:unnamed protein product [Echinostoma caproni]|uniref:Tetratricopeptide repeat protein 29 n=1 Tax=Echinostoma caproni TaxID=27848 RepID=A0A183ADW8_9TREM|nr:unnamed protein product [Echinostoma caproni]
MDLPLSAPFLYLLTEEGNRKSPASVNTPADEEDAWPSDILDFQHFVEIYQERGRFLKDLMIYCREKKAIKFAPGSVEYLKADLQLQQRIFSCDLESLCITMTFGSVTQRFGQTEFPLTRRYDTAVAGTASTDEVDESTESDETLCSSNAESYVRRCLHFALEHGIRRQLNAFRAGFERVIPISSLSMFTPKELGQLISGESSPVWNAKELWTHCEPAAGYNRNSKGFLMLIETLASFDTIERRAFLRFVTGTYTHSGHSSVAYWVHAEEHQNSGSVVEQSSYKEFARAMNDTADKIPSYSSCYAGRHAAQSLISKYTGYATSATGISCELVNRNDPPIECNIGCNVSNLTGRKLAPLNCGPLGETLNDQATKHRLRAELPHLTRRDISKIREPIYDILCQSLLQNGYHKSFAEIFHLYEKQNEDRRLAGPDSPLWFIPPIAEQPDKIKLLAYHLSEAESALRRRDPHTVFSSYLLLGREFQDCPDDVWLAEHFFQYALQIAEGITDDDKLKLAVAHQHYGLVLQMRGQLALAAQSLREFYRLTREKQWTNDCGQLLSRLASQFLVDNYLKQIDDCPEDYHSNRIELCRQAHKIALECNDWDTEAMVWLRLGQLLEEAGYYDEALECLNVNDCRDSIEAARIMIGVSRAHLMNQAYVLNMQDENPPGILRLISWKSKPVNEEQVFPIKELKLPPIRFNDRQPNRDVLTYSKHPATGFLHRK